MTDNIIDLSEVRAAASGIVTPRSVLEAALSVVDGISAVVVAAYTRNGAVATAFSTDNRAVLLGMLEIAKDDVLNAGGDE